MIRRISGGSVSGSVLEAVFIAIFYNEGVFDFGNGVERRSLGAVEVEEEEVVLMTQGTF